MGNRTARRGSGGPAARLVALARDERGFVSITPAQVPEIIGHFRQGREQEDILDLALPVDSERPTLLQKFAAYLGAGLDKLPFSLGNFLSFAIRMRNTHGDIVHDVFHSVPGCADILDLDVAVEYASQPDLRAFFSDIMQVTMPGVARTTPAGAYDQFYNPYADGEKGGGKAAAKTVYEAFFDALSLDDNMLASMNAGKLAHYLSDIVVPFHALGAWNGEAWTAPHTREHGRLEVEISLKHFACRVTPDYLPGGPAGLERRYEREARHSHRRAARLSFSKKEMQDIYERSVQITADAFYSALVDNKLIRKLDPAQRLMLRARYALKLY